MRQRRFFSKEVKDKIVNEYTSGVKTSTQLSQEYSIPINFIYRWYAERRPITGNNNTKITPNEELNYLKEQLNLYKTITGLLLKEKQ